MTEIIEEIITQEEKDKNFIENIITSLPEWQRVFCHSPAFEDCIRILKEMQKLVLDGEEWKMKQCELLHAKMVFDDLCAKDPECLKQKNIVDHRKEMEEKEKRFRMLFEKHKKMILEN